MHLAPFPSAIPLLTLPSSLPVLSLFLSCPSLERPKCHQYINARVTVHWGKGNNLTFQGLGNTGSELILILGDPKKHCTLQLKVGLMEVR